MTMVVTDRVVEERLKRERRASGADRYDEVWEGIYMMTPMPNNEHQELVAGFTAILQEIVVWPRLGKVCPGVNLTGRGDDWEHDYRVPDVAVFLRAGRAEDLGTHWRGAADFLVEITSPDDQTRDKLSFYGRLGVREILVVDRQSWSLELCRNVAGAMEHIEETSADSGRFLSSEVVPLAFRLVPGDPRPEVEVKHLATGRCWVI
jgi:Uma2 family endonuclease